MGALDYLGNPIYNVLLGTLFQWGVALHRPRVEKLRKKREDLGGSAQGPAVIGKKVGKQAGKDY